MSDGSWPIRVLTAAAVAAWAAGCQRRGQQSASPVSSPGQPSPGQVIANSIGMKLAYVPPGEFLMGSPPDEPGRHDDETRHQVTISRGFYIGTTEVTQAQWLTLMPTNPSDVQGDDLPVSKVSWHAAVAFCRKLSQKEGRTCRLPTEAEWEYACRAGSPGAFAGAGRADDVCWHMDNSSEQPQPVARKRPNAWGLFDMHGNAMEWCSDWYQRDYPTAPAADPTGPQDGTRRVARGGSWAHFARACRSAARADINPAYQLRHVGFRIVMEDGARGAELGTGNAEHGPDSGGPAR